VIPVSKTNHQWSLTRPIQGAGIGLRSCHFNTIIENQPPVAWFEALSDNYMVDGGGALQCLEAVRQHYPIVLHGVGMSLGSTDPINQDYLKKLKKLITRFEPAWISDHLCWVSVRGHYLHDLLPLPFTKETINHLVQRIQQVQDFLGVRILIENLSSYFEYKQNEMMEWEFINSITEKADCYLLLDINNIYVSAFNHGLDPEETIKQLMPGRVKQFHMAGFADKHNYLFDNHGEMVHQSVWDLYQVALDHFGPIPTLIEWDENIPPFSVLQAEAGKAQELIDKVPAKKRDLLENKQCC